MRYSIFEFSQEKLLEYNLDVADALILNWFANFFIGGMEKRIFQDGNVNKIYGWIKISKIMEDLPVLGISTEKGIRRRLDHFVESGIMERETIQSQNGKKSFYKTTEVYESLINTKAVKKNQNKEAEKTKELDDPSENNTEISQGNCSSYAENENPQGTKTTYAEIKTGQKSPQGNCSSYAERNSTSLAEGNSSSYALNDSLTSDSVIKDSQIKFNDVRNSAAVNAYSTNIKKQIQDISEKYFGKNAFDFSFADKAAAFFKNQNLKPESVELYFGFIKNKVCKKQAENPRGLAYRVFFQNDIMQEFLTKQHEFILEQKEKQEKEAALEKKRISCPCCNTRFVRTAYIQNCPECDFPIDHFENEKEIEKHKKYMLLPEEKRRQYDREICGFKIELPFVERIKYIGTSEGKKMAELYEHSVNRKYGIEV